MVDKDHAPEEVPQAPCDTAEDAGKAASPDAVPQAPAVEPARTDRSPVAVPQAPSQ
jgi:hypothetical protein